MLSQAFLWQSKPKDSRAARNYTPNAAHSPITQNQQTHVFDEHSTAKFQGDSATAHDTHRHLVVGARGFATKQPGTGTQETGSAKGIFHVTVNSSRANDALGIYVGLIDSSVGFRHESWGRALAMGVHGGNLFEWVNPKASGFLVRNALPGYEESPTSGSVISVRVDLDKNLLEFSVNEGPFTQAKGVQLPASVRPFICLSGHEGDSVSLFYDEKAPPAMPTPQVSQVKTFAPVRESGDSVMVPLVQ